MDTTRVYTLGAAVPGTGDCEWVAHLDNINGYHPNRARLKPNRLYRISFLYNGSVEKGYDYFYCSDTPGPGSPAMPDGTVYCPYGGTDAFPDYLFYEGGDGVRVLPTRFMYGGITKDDDIQIYFPESDWVLPLDYWKACAVALNCPSTLGHIQDVVFLTPQSSPPYVVSNLRSLASAPPFAFTPTWTFDAADVSRLEFDPGQRLTIGNGGSLTASGVDFTASGSSWKGIRFDPGASGVLTGGTIDKVTNGPSGYAVRVKNADLTVAGVRIESISGGDSGIFATGRNADVTVTGQTVITGHGDGYGLYAANGARILVTTDDPLISTNASGGIRATGIGAEITVEGGTIATNLGTGAYASTGGIINLLRGSGPGQLPITILGNVGGLEGDTGTIVATNTLANNFPDNGDANAVFGQNSLPLDASSRDGSALDAENVWWGETQRANVSTWEEPTATLDIDPILTAQASLTSGATPAAASKAGDDDGLHTSVVEAERMRRDGDTAGASALLAGALATATTERERAVLGSAAVRLLGDPRAAAPGTELLTWAASASRAPGADRPWALRAQAAAAMNGGDASGAHTAAEALLREGPRHAVFARHILVRLATEAGDERGALYHLAALAALDAASAADAALSVSAQFEDADVTQALQSAHAPSSNKSISTIPASLTVSIQPNPAARRAEVVLTVPETAGEIALSVFDALGREVATMEAEGTGAARRAWLDASALAPGVYVARAVVLADGAVVSSAVARFTVTR